MDKKKTIMIKVIILLFTLSVSSAVIPCNIINVYGLFGELQSFTVNDNNEVEISEINTVKITQSLRIKGQNVINVWFAVLMLVVFTQALIYSIGLPHQNTVVTLKVRMDN